MTKVRLRFAPSPTGYLHIGGLRTALYNYLYAKKQEGDFLLRIEDTDRTRFVEGAVENLIHSLSWANLEIDEGVKLSGEQVVQAGPHAPYVQSERVSMGIYDQVADKLVEEGHAYPCFCTRERLDNLRAQQKADGKVPRYDGLCRAVDPAEAKARIANGEEHVLRMKLPVHEMISFDDLIRGHMDIATEDMDDQVLIKSDGFPTYHLAVVVDDHDMGITHVVRGEEWLPSTPKHVFLYDVLGWEKPVYVHLPTVLNKDHKKLSKRNDDVAVEDFIAQGYLPEGLINYLALVGWSPVDNQEIFSMEELIEAFDFSRVSSSGGIFDRDKLNWVNAQHIKAKSDEELVDLLKPYLLEAGRIQEDTDPAWLALLAATYKESLQTLAQIVPESEMVFADAIVVEEADALSYLEKPETAILAASFKNQLLLLESFELQSLKGLMKSVQKETGIKGKDLFMPVRAMLTGTVHGPDLTNVFLLLGKEKLLNRIEKYL